MSSKEVIIDKDIIAEMLSENSFDNIEQYINYMKNMYGLSPYKKDIRKSKYSGLGEGENKMNHYCLSTGYFGYKFRYYIMNKHKWFLVKIKYGI